MDKNKYLNQIITSHRQLERYIFYFEKGEDGEFKASERPKFSWEEMYTPAVVDEYSFRDLLAFILTWEKRLRGWIQVGFQHEKFEEPPLDVDWDYMLRGNDSHFDLERQQPVELVLPAMMLSYREIMDILVSLPNQDFFETGRYGWTGEKSLSDYLEVYMVELYDWAKQHIRRWKRTHPGKQMNKSILLDKILKERHRLEKQLEGLTPEVMQTAGVIGSWSIKDILAHLIDWEQRFLGWYHAGLRGEDLDIPAPGMTWRDLDLLNQKIYEKNKDRSLKSVMREFDASYHQIMETVRDFEEEEIFEPGHYPWLGRANLLGYIEANTFNHYMWAERHIRTWLANQRKGG